MNRYSPDQLLLLLGDKANDESPVDNNTDDSDENPPSQLSAKPKKRGRRKLPDHLPRVDVEHTLDEQACQCEHCQAMMEPLS